jgi:hypothetical protein
MTKSSCLVFQLFLVAKGGGQPTFFVVFCRSFARLIGAEHNILLRPRPKLPRGSFSPVVVSSFFRSFHSLSCLSNEKKEKLVRARTPSVYVCLPTLGTQELSESVLRTPWVFSGYTILPSSAGTRDGTPVEKLRMQKKLRCVVAGAAT